MVKGQKYINADKFDPARKAFGQALKMHPNNAQILRQQAALELDSGNAKRAVPILRKITKLQPDDIDLSLRLVEALEDSGDIAGALLAVRQVLQRHPDHAVALKGLCQHRGLQRSSDHPYPQPHRP